MNIVENRVTIGEITGRSLMFLMTHGVIQFSLFFLLGGLLMPNLHRPTRLDQTVLSRRIGR